MSEFREGTLADVDGEDWVRSGTPFHSPTASKMQYTSHAAIWVRDGEYWYNYVPMWWHVLDRKLEDNDYCNQLFIDLNDAYREEDEEKVNSIRAVMEMLAENIK